MQTAKEKFTHLIKGIVYKEMDADQQTAYELEGTELIDRLLDAAAESEEAERDKARELFMGVSQESIEGIKVVAEFAGLLISCVGLFLEIRSLRGNKFSKKMEKVEAQKKLLDLMKEQQMPPELIEKINQKYSDSLIDALNELT